MIAALAFGSFGLLLLMVAMIVLGGLRKNRLHLRDLGQEVERVNHRLLTPEERAAEARRIETIEARNREIHGRFDSGGC